MPKFALKINHQITKKRLKYPQYQVLNIYVINNLGFL